MYKEFDNKYYFYDKKDGIDIFDPFMPDFSNYLYSIQTLRPSTINRNIQCIHKFWIYMLYFPPKEKQSFENYIGEYRTVLLERGFKVEKDIEYNGFKYKKKVYEYGIIKATMKAEMIALEKYFSYVNDEAVNPKYDISNNITELYKSTPNFKKIDNAARRSVHSSYGLKPTGLARYALAEAETVFTKFKRSKLGTNDEANNIAAKAMPLSILIRLVQTTKNDKQKLLYLLCAGTSARIGQALTLTILDVDIKNKKVYLTDPRTNQKPCDEYGNVFLDQPPRKKLLSKYGINFNDKKYREIGFKNRPIPIIGSVDRSLLFVSPVIEKMFFDTYMLIKPTLNDRNPFVFQTATSNLNIINPKNARTKMGQDLKKVAENYPELKQQIERLIKSRKKFHSLRHQYCVSMAEKAAYLQEIERMKPRAKGERIPDMVGYIKQLTAVYTGHESDAIDIYFNRSIYSMKNLKIIFNEVDEGIRRFEENVKAKKKILEAMREEGTIDD